MHARPADDATDRFAADFAAALDWWREAGVDFRFEDVPRRWIVEPPGAPGDAGGNPDTAPAAMAAPAAPPPRAMIGGDRETWPQTLADFAPWWLGEPSLDPGLDPGRLHGRVPPRGPGEAALMVLVAEPEAGDGDTLLSGPQGKLLDAMLLGMGIAADRVYVASALVRHTPMADWVDLAARGVGEVVRRHIALARPQRAITFGRHVAALLGQNGLVLPRGANGSAQMITILPEDGHVGVSVPLLIARDLGALLQRPIAKGAFWQQWLEWSVGEQANGHGAGSK